MPRNIDRHGRIKKKNKFRMSKPSLASSSKQKFYAVQNGRDGYSGVLNTWEECRYYVHRIKGAVFKSFNTYEEALVFSTLQSKNYPSSENRSGAGNNAQLPSATTQERKKVNIEAIANSLKHSDESIIDLEAENWKDQAKHSGLAETLPTASAKISGKAPRATRLTIYTDGACSNNGRWNSLAGYGVYFGKDSPYNISEPLPGPATNQRAEMMAILEALRTVLSHQLVTRGGFVQIRTDSQYAKQGIESWVANWKQNNWRARSGGEVKNKDLWLALDNARIALLEHRVQLELVWVKGHAGCPGNEAADFLATQGAKRAVR